MSEQEHDPSNERDAAFVERVSRGYGPPARSDAERAAFDARLRERLEQHSSAGSWVGRLVPALVVAAVASMLFLVRSEPTAPTEPAPAVVASTQTTKLVLPSSPAEALMALADDDSEGIAESLPDDYAAIESLLLGS